MSNFRPLIVLALILALSGCQTWHPLGIGPKAEPPQAETPPAKAEVATAPAPTPASAPIAEPAADRDDPDRPLEGNLEAPPTTPTPEEHMVCLRGTWYPVVHHACTTPACPDAGKWVYMDPAGKQRFLPGDAYGRVIPKPAATSTPAPTPAPKAAPVPTELREQVMTRRMELAHGDVAIYSDLNGWEPWPIRDANHDGWYEVVGSTDHPDARGVVISNGPVRFTFQHRCTPDCTEKCWKWARIGNARCRAHGESFDGGDIALALVFDSGTIKEVECQCKGCKGHAHPPIVRTERWAYSSPEVRARHRPGCTFCKEESTRAEWHEYDLELAGAVLTPCQKACKRHADGTHPSH